MQIRSRKARFITVSLLPLLLMALWLANGGYKHFMQSHRNATCDRQSCTSWAADEPLDYGVGVFLGSPFAGGVMLTGNLSAWIVSADSGSRKFLSIPASRADRGPCFLSYFDKVEHQVFDAGTLKTDSTVADVFTLDCGGASTPMFRFADKELQVALRKAWSWNELDRESFNEDQKHISILAFAAPFVTFGLIWLGVAVFYKIVKYVLSGSAKRGTE